MTAVDAVSLNLSLLQTICAGVLFACFVGAIIAAGAFIVALAYEQIKLLRVRADVRRVLFYRT